jgi:hypothetical protein
MSDVIWRTWKSQRMLFRIVVIFIIIWTVDLTNTKQECLPHQDSARESIINRPLSSMLWFVYICCENLLDLTVEGEIILRGLVLLLLRGCIAQGVPCTVTISDIFYVSIWIVIISDPSTRLWKLPAEKSSSEAGKTWRGMAVNFAYEMSLAYL